MMDFYEWFDELEWNLYKTIQKEEEIEEEIS